MLEHRIEHFVAGVPKFQIGIAIFICLQHSKLPVMVTEK